MTSMLSVNNIRPEIELPRGQSETFTEEVSSNTPGSNIPRSSTIRVPSCRPTPLIGSWADESFPLNSRQASEIVAEQVLQKQCSSTLFEDENGNVMLCPSEPGHYSSTSGNNTQINYDVIGAAQNADDNEEDSSCADDSESMVNESLMQEAMSHAQISHESVGGRFGRSSHGSHTDCDETDGETTQEHCESYGSLDSATHIAQSYMYDPYHISESKTVLVRCSCDACICTLQQKIQQEQMLQQLSAPVHEKDSVSNQITPAADVNVSSAAKSDRHAFLAAPPEFVQVEHPENDNNHDDWDLPNYTPYPQPQQQQQQEAAPVVPMAPQFHQFPQAPANAGNANGGGFMTHTQLSSPPFMDMNTPTQSPGNMNATPSSTISGLSHPPPTQRRFVPATEKPVVEREVSSFMPPPPPPRIATMVFEEEQSIKNPSGIYYHLVMRWYSKVLESQDYFVTSEELCPAPNKDLYSFEQWADEVSGWWYTHFEHMQKKAPRFARRR